MNRQIRLSHRRDHWMWLSVAILLVVGAVASMYLQTLPWPITAIGWVVLIGVVGFIAINTHKGRNAWHFLKEAKQEVRRVVWPTRKETVQMTMLVMIMTVVVALILWGVDSLLLVAIRWFTGHGS